MSQTPSENAKKVLVVDDEPHIVRVVALKMQNAGFLVETAEDGEEAYETAIEFRPDIIITDYTMPFMTGLELAIKLKRDERTTQTPVIMLTARGYGLSKEDLAKTNIQTVMSKPFGPRDLLATVNALLERDQDDPTMRRADAA